MRFSYPLHRLPPGHAALREPAGSGSSHLQPCPQQELQTAGVDGASQQRDQTHQQLHSSGLKPGGREDAEQEADMFNRTGLVAAEEFFCFRWQLMKVCALW